LSNCHHPVQLNTVLVKSCRWSPVLAFEVHVAVTGCHSGAAHTVPVQGRTTIVRLEASQQDEIILLY
jgi:hypothetical protein